MAKSPNISRLKKPSRGKYLMQLSIIIPTYNRSVILKRLLEHLETQTDKDFEVIVAMDGCSDNTEDMLQNLTVSYELRWVNTNFKGYGLAIARNRGVLEALGEIVAIIDDDSFPQPEYVAAYKTSASRWTITAGPRTPADDSEIRQLEKMRYLDSLPHNQPLKFDFIAEKFPKASITECNICMYRDDIIKMGLFSERLTIYGFIGQEFFNRARHLGLRYKYDPNAETIHDRQIEGTAGLNDRRKTREIMFARALLPAFTKPEQYRRQVEWAARMAAAKDGDRDLPAFPIEGIVLFPYRFLRNRLGDIRRAIRNRRQVRPQ
tara:strand:- start:26 stop:985 length:960 start_codon:yes stop_codon:yes gene_type:complete